MKPTKFIEVYEDCKLDNMEFGQDDDGTPVITYSLTVPKQTTQIQVSVTGDGSDQGL